jgi:hypothetical protein
MWPVGEFPNLESSRPLYLQHCTLSPSNRPPGKFAIAVAIGATSDIA